MNAHHQHLSSAQANLQGLKWRLSLSAVLPLPLLALGVWMAFEWESHWYKDPLIALILGFFAVGQFAMTWHSWQLWQGAHKAKQTLALFENGWNQSLEQAQNLLLKAPNCHLRDVLEGWLMMAARKDMERFDSLLDRQADQREQSGIKKLGFHVAINRASLKLGFIGTLIGLLLTFEPMKDALVTLQKDDGELGFITDIARAIDGDKYAILTTLLATAFSVVVETINIQWLERLLAKFEATNNHLEQWNLTVLRAQTSSETHTNANEIHLLLAELATATRKAREELETITQLQISANERVAQLAKQDALYRAFIKSRTVEMD